MDLVLAGDNAIVVGIAVAGLPAQQRWRVMVLGIAAATLLRIVFAVFTVQLLQIIGLLLAGGLLLLWVADFHRRSGISPCPEEAWSPV